MSSLQERLSQYDCGNGTSVATFKILDPGLKINVSRDNIYAFYKTMCDASAKDSEDDCSKSTSTPSILFGHTVAEYITNKVLLHASFKIESDAMMVESQFDAVIYEVVTIINTIISNQVINYTSTMQSCIIEKSALYLTGGTHKLNFRITYPNCCVNTKYYNEVFIPQLTDNISRSPDLNTFGVSDILTKSLTRVRDFFLMYRGKERDDDLVMEFNSCYRINDEGDAEIDSFSQELFPPNYDIFDGALEDIYPIASDDQRQLYYLNVVLSTNYSNTVETIKSKIAVSSDNLDTDYFVNNSSSTNPEVMVRLHLPMINKKRFAHEYYRREIVSAINTVFEGNDVGLSLVMRYAAHTGDTEMLTDLYNSCSGSHLTEKTIAWYARIDNPKAYNEWHERWCVGALNASLEEGEYPISEFVYCLMWLDFVFNPNSGTWYRFEKNRLIAKPKNFNFIDIMRGKAIVAYREYGVKLSQNARDKPGDAKVLSVMCESVDRILKTLNKLTPTEKIAKAAMVRFAVNNFDDIIDRDPRKTCWSNCIVYCGDTEAYAVDGKIEDFITKTTNCHYRKEYSMSHANVKAMMHWMRQIFHEEETVHYMLKYIASLLYGKNTDKSIMIFTGNGDNSKTMFVTAISSFLGSYYADIPESVFTGRKTNSSQPSPELVQAMGAHAVSVAEASSGRSMEESELKKFSGMESIYARSLYSNGGRFELTGKVIIMCNDIPNFSKVTTALLNRIAIIHFGSTWSDNAPSDPDEQRATRTYKNDRKFIEKIPKYAEALGWLAVHYYRLYLSEGLVKPKSVDEFIENHWKSSDPTNLFCNENLENAYTIVEGKKVPDTKKIISALTLYTTFRPWHIQMFPGVPIPDVRTFRSALDRLLGESKTGHWVGIKFKEGESHSEAVSLPTKNDDVKIVPSPVRQIKSGVGSIKIPGMAF